ncbi:uncharacterized protein [Anabrus simplex]|uniref:uncharacterized protein n=1 Tax=Anabrus simplex TaxID=316456 RepID=UPI0034DD091C
MDLEIDIKEEPVWLEETANPPPVSNLLLPAPDKLAEVKFEPEHVFAVKYLEGAGVSLVKEENKIEDVKKETQDDGFDPLEDTVHDCSTWCNTFGPDGIRNT